jgi:hypothetical protein
MSTNIDRIVTLGLLHDICDRAYAYYASSRKTA